MFAKEANKLSTDENLSEFAKTELNSALATLEVMSGSARNARRMFRKSLTDPNENSLAQAQWAEQQVGGIGIEGNKFQVPRSFEASGYLDFALADWEGAQENALRWFKDQRFSSRPAIFFSYVSSSLLDQFDESEQVLRAALVANPDSPPA